jgi:hypothetical protein
MNSEITLQEALFDSGIIDKFGCCKIFINDKVLWDDDIALWEYIRLEEAWEKYKATRLNYEDYKVIKIDIKIVDFHHSIIRVYCEK